MINPPKASSSNVISTQTLRQQNNGFGPAMSFFPSMGSERVHITQNASSTQNSDSLPLSNPFAYRQEFLQTSTTAYDMEPAFDMSDSTSKRAELPPDLNLNSLASEGRSGFQFPLQNDEDLNSLLWSDTLFGRR